MLWFAIVMLSVSLQNFATLHLYVILICFIIFLLSTLDNILQFFFCNFRMVVMSVQILLDDISKLGI